MPAQAWHPGSPLAAVPRYQALVSMGRQFSRLPERFSGSHSLPADGTPSIEFFALLAGLDPLLAQDKWDTDRSGLQLVLGYASKCYMPEPKQSKERRYGILLRLTDVQDDALRVLRRAMQPGVLTTQAVIIAALDYLAKQYGLTFPDTPDPPRPSRPDTKTQSRPSVPSLALGRSTKPHSPQRQ